MKSCRHAFLLSSLLLAANCLTPVVVSTANAALILNNGSFENPVEPEGGFSVVPTGWTTPEATGAIIHPPGSLGPLYPPAQNGLQYELLNSGSIRQVFTVVTAGDYQLTWFDNTLTDRSTDYQVYVYDHLNLNNIIASTTVASFHGAATWNARSLSMTLAAGDYDLRFNNPGGAGNDYYALDNASIAPVPEPPTIFAVALLLLPIGITILRTLRKTRAVQPCHPLFAAAAD